eukprot:scaffold49910_cov39-Prasinocladus_malaysianus.AAC.2
MGEACGGLYYGLSPPVAFEPNSGIVLFCNLTPGAPGANIWKILSWLFMHRCFGGTFNLFCLTVV